MINWIRTIGFIRFWFSDLCL